MARKSGPDMAFLAAMLKEYGGEEASQVEVEKYVPRDNAAEVAERNRQITMLEKEAVLKHQHYRHSLMFKTCRYCEATFQTNYCYVAYCSDGCRNDAFYERYHVRWNRIDHRHEFEYEEFAVVSPEKTEALYRWAQGFVKAYDEFKLQTPTQTTDPLRADSEIALDRILTEEEKELLEPELHSVSGRLDNPPATEDGGSRYSQSEQDEERPEFSFDGLDEEFSSPFL